MNNNNAILFISVFFLSCMCSLTETAFTLFKSEMMSHFDVLMIKISLATALFYVYNNIFYYIWQRLLGRYEMHCIFLCLCAATLCALLAVYVANSYWIILTIGTLLNGCILAGSYIGAVNSLSAIWAFEKADNFVSLLYFVTMGANSYVLSFLDSLYDWQSVYLIMAGIALNYLPLALILKSFKPKSSSSIKNKQTEIMEAQKSRANCNKFSLKLALLFLAVNMNNKTYANFKSYLPFYLQEYYNQDMLMIGRTKSFIFILRALFGLVSFIAIQRKTFNTEHAFFTYQASVTCGLFANVLSILPNYPQELLFILWILFALSNVSVGLFSAVISQFLSNTTRVSDAAVLSVSCGSIIILVLGAINGLVYDWFGSVAAIYIMSSLQCFLTVLILFYLRVVKFKW